MKSRRVANIYGYNANMFAENMRALLDSEADGDFEFLGTLGIASEELGGLVADLDNFRTGYRACVHGKKRLSEMETDYDSWVRARNAAYEITLGLGEWLREDPRRWREVAVGTRIEDQGLTLEQAIEEALRMGLSEFERTLQGYEDARPDRAEVSNVG
jgi:hypothetical protein